MIGPDEAGDRDGGRQRGEDDRDQPAPAGPARFFSSDSSRRRSLSSRSTPSSLVWKDPAPDVPRSSIRSSRAVSASNSKRLGGPFAMLPSIAWLLPGRQHPGKR